MFIADATIGSPKFLHTIFGKYFDHVLVKFEQTIFCKYFDHVLVKFEQTIQNLSFLRKKEEEEKFFDKVLTPVLKTFL